MTRILVADDDKHFAQVLARLFAAEGYQVLEARNGRDALDLANAHAPALLVLDVALPLMTGDEVARALDPATPILFVSGRDRDRLDDGLFTGPHRRFLRKPADLDEVLETARALLGEKP